MPGHQTVTSGVVTTLTAHKSLAGYEAGLPKGLLIVG